MAIMRLKVSIVSIRIMGKDMIDLLLNVKYEYLYVMNTLL